MEMLPVPVCARRLGMGKQHLTCLERGVLLLPAQRAVLCVLGVFHFLCMFCCLAPHARGSCSAAVPPEFRWSSACSSLVPVEFRVSSGPILVLFRSRSGAGC